MAGSVRKLYGEIFLKDKASKDIDKVNDSLDTTKTSALGLDGALGLIGGAAVTAAFSMLAKASFDAGVELELQTTRLEVLSGDAYPELAKSMEATIAASEGLTATGDMATAMNQALKMGSSIDTLTGSMSELQKLSEITGDDLTNTMRNMSRSISTGSTRFLEQNPILAKNIAGFKALGMGYDEATKKKRSLFIVDMLQKSQIKIQNQYNKIIQTTAGQLKIVSTQWGNVKETIGGVIMTGLKPLITWGAKVLRFLGETEKGILITKIAFTILAGIVGGIFVATIWSAVVAFKALFIAALPWIVIGAGIIAVLLFLYLLVDDIITAFQGGESYVGDLWKWFMGLLKKVPKLFNQALNYVTTTISRWVDSIAEYGTALIDYLFPIDALIEKFWELIDWIKKIPGKIVDMFSNLGSMISSSLSGMFDKIKELVPDFVLKFMGVDGSKKIASPEGRASGGAVYPDQSYVVGESGAELFIPDSAGMIVPGLTSGAVSSNSLSIKNLVGAINITVASATEGAEEIKDIILDALDDLSSNIFPAELGVAIT